MDLRIVVLAAGLPVVRTGHCFTALAGIQPWATKICPSFFEISFAVRVASASTVAPEASLTAATPALTTAP